MNTHDLRAATSQAAILSAVQGIAEATALLAQQSAALVAAMTAVAVVGHSENSTIRSTAKPTVEQCQAPQNKIGVNLSPRGIEMIYRLYDHGSSVRAASIALAISHRAAKWRKSAWEKAGGNNRPVTILDID